MTGLADLLALGYDVDIAPDGSAAAVRGFGIATMIDPADEKTIAALADPAGHAERRFQFLEPDAYTARVRLEAAGYTFARPDPSVDAFAVQAPLGQPVAAGLTTPAALIALAQTAIKPKPLV